MKRFRHPVNLALLFIQLAALCYFFYSCYADDVVPSLKSYTGMGLLMTLLFCLYLYRNLFTLGMALNLLLGNFVLISALPEISTRGFYFNIGSLSIPVYWGQPFYSALLVVYIAFNKEFFIGILNRDYWATFFQR